MIVKYDRCTLKHDTKYQARIKSEIDVGYDSLIIILEYRSTQSSYSRI
jgi:hypothetical protein